MSSIFDKIIPGKGKEEKKEKKEEKKAPEPKKEKTKTQTQTKSTALPGVLGETVLVGPWLTEKSRDMEEKGKYVFQVKPNANKSEVKKEVERRYDVTVKNVNITKKRTRARQFRGRRGGSEVVKKAIVTVKEGDKIEIFPV